MNNTTITYERVKENAATIRTCATNMSKIFEDFESAMRFLKNNSALVGQAGDALEAKFNSLKSKFTLYTDAVERFANLIDNANDETQKTEGEITNVADQLAG